MDHIEVRNILVNTLKGGDKTPGLFSLPKLLGLKSKLESCIAMNEVVAILEDNRSLITKSFGISDVAFDQGIEKLNTLKTTT